MALTYGFAEQARVMTSKLVAQAAFDRSKGGILPLAAREELSALASAPEDATEIDAAPPQPSSPQLRPANPSPELTATRSADSPESLYAKGVAMMKEGRLRDGSDLFELAGTIPVDMLTAMDTMGMV